MGAFARRRGLAIIVTLGVLLLLTKLNQSGSNRPPAVVSVPATATAASDATPLLMLHAGVIETPPMDGALPVTAPLHPPPMGSPATASTVPGSPKSLPALFRETADSVQLGVAGGRISIARRAWNVTLLSATGTALWQQPTLEAGSGESAAYGAPGFLIDPTLLPDVQARVYGSRTQRWFHLTAITAVDWQNPVLRLEVQTDDPTGRRATVRFQTGVPGTILMTMALSDSSGVISSAISNTVLFDEHFFGLGQQQPRVDQRGQRVIGLTRGWLVRSDRQGSYAPYPFYLSSPGYGLLVQTQRPTIFDMAANRSDASLIQVNAANMNLAFFIDPDPRQIMISYSALAGRPPLPPPWTFGVWKTSIGGQARVLAEAQRLRDAHIPVSALLIYDAVDPQSGTGWDSHVFAPVPPGSYTDLAAMNMRLHALGYKTLSYVEEGIQADQPRYAEGVARGYFVHNPNGQSYRIPLSPSGEGMLDLTNPAAVTWFQDGLHRLLVDLHFDGAMQDSGDIAPFDAVFANGQNGYDMANIYPVLYAKATYDAAQRFKPDAVFQMRAGALGAQQYQTAVREGDLESQWSPYVGYPAALPSALSRGIAGSPFMGTDIGGYRGVPLPADEVTELYVRWAEYAAFTPTMRDILGLQPANATYVWSNAETVETFTRYARVHTDLFPLLYTLAKEASTTGIPLMRLPYMVFPHDKGARTQEDEFFLGNDLLVAPVLKFRDTQKEVYFPPGLWIDMWTGAQTAGGQILQVPADRNIIPVFVRAGAIIPTLLRPEPTLAVADPLSGGLHLTFYPDPDVQHMVETTLYEGTHVIARQNTPGYDIRVDAPMARPYRIDVPTTAIPLSVMVEGLDGFGPIAANSDGSGWWYDATLKRTIIQVTGRNVHLHLTVTPASAIARHVLGPQA